MFNSASSLSRPVTHQTLSLKHAGPIPRQTLARVKAELRQHGAVAYDLWLPETHYLPHLLRPYEQVTGSAFGRYKDGRGALVATDQRVIFLDKKPLFLHYTELEFSIIRGVTYTKTVLTSTITLHTRIGDYSLLTLNHKNAVNLANFIESKIRPPDPPYHVYDYVE